MKCMVFIERNPIENTLRDVSLELAWKGHSLVKEYGGEVVAFYIGKELPSDIEKLFEYGADKLIHHLDSRLEYLHSEVYKEIVVDMVRNESPDMVLFGATHTGRDVAPLVASNLRTGLTADCTQLYLDEYKDKGTILYQKRPAFGGNILATIVTPDERPMMATVREGVMPLPEQGEKKSGVTVVHDFSLNNDWFKYTIKEVVPGLKKINLGAHDIIVAGGAGMESKEGFAILHQLADALGGEVAASRAAVDFGFTQKDRQVGQTGSVVRPKLYIAVGISGSIQHRAGMEDSQKIIAINKDSEAPIFGIANMGIVGDYRDVIPVMIKYLKED